MTNRQENKLSMYHTTEKVLNDNITRWNSIPAFVSTANNYFLNISSIVTAVKEQLGITTGIATDKKKLKLSLVNLFSPVIGNLVAFASHINNNELLEEMSFTRTGLLETRDELLASQCKAILDRANNNIAALTAYGTTPLYLTSVQTALNSFISKTSAPRVARVHKTTVTKNLSELFKQTDVLLKLQLDNLMLQLKPSAPDFYNTYKAARQIIDLGTTHTSLRVTIKDNKGNLLSSATVSLLQDNRTAYTKTSSDSGQIHISRVSPATYDIKIEKSNFKSFTELEVKFTSGKALNRVIQLYPA